MTLWEFATKQREEACAIECPVISDCSLERRPGDTEAEYKERCDAVAEGIREGIELVSTNAGDDNDDDVDVEDEDNEEGEG